MAAPLRVVHAYKTRHRPSNSLSLPHKCLAKLYSPHWSIRTKHQFNPLWIRCHHSPRRNFGPLSLSQFTVFTGIGQPLGQTFSPPGSDCPSSPHLLLSSLITPFLPNPGDAGRDPGGNILPTAMGPFLLLQRSFQSLFLPKSQAICDTSKLCKDSCCTELKSGIGHKKSI